MIVKMKKISVILLDSHREESISELGRLGVLHLEPMKGEGERLTALRATEERLRKVEQALPLDVKGGRRREIESADFVQIEKIVDEVSALDEEAQRTEELVERLSREAERLEPWGRFEPADVRFLREHGIDLRLYVISANRLKELGADAKPFVNFRTKSKIGCTTVGRSEAFREDEELTLPEQGLATVRRRIKENTERLSAIETRLQQLAHRRDLIEEHLKSLGQDIEFEEVRTGLASEEGLAFLTGYVPDRGVKALGEAAAAHGWGLLIRDPEPDDPVPTLVENPRWIRIIKPMFSFLGLVPGYKEFDISPWFLIFFSVFFALLIGDAAYGLIFLVVTIFARFRMPKARPEFFRMMYVFSICTIAWGAVTGTWFGSEAISQNSFLSKLIIPQLYSFDSGNNSFIMYLCFTIALAHLTLAHLLNVVKKLPSLVAVSDIGAIGLIWGLYFLVITLVVGKPLNPAALWLIIGGLGVEVVFSDQNGNFGKGILVGLAKLPLKLLNSVSAFSDIVSYVRLFAVGLATVAVAESFNGMAMGAVNGGVLGYVAMAVILLLGHGLNIALGALALIVHGVRLNLLEFSGHLEMEWSGVAYRPFTVVKEKLVSNK